MASSPFVSINNMLIHNRCWLCEQPFQRGKMKKVFQLSDLLEYYLQRSLAEINDASSVPPMKCKNFHDCYDNFKSLLFVNDHGNIDTSRLLENLKNNDLETWMSGMVCGLHENCQEDMAKFVKDLTPPSNTTSNDATNKRFKTAFGNQDCPPGCNCDNPWPFLA